MPAEHALPIDRVLDALARAGSPAKKVGRQLMARCPAHGDNTPSLAVREVDNGNVVLCCHGGCTTPAVMAAIGLHLRDLFPDKPAKVTAIGPAGRIKAIYPYADEHGEVLFEVVRFEPKTFRQRRRNGDGWVWNLDGVRRVLYMLPQVRRAVADGATVVVCEGEKDAENAQWLFNAAATTTPMGAGKWDDSYTAALEGAANVVVVADDDPSGHNHARAVVRALSGHVGRLSVFLPADGHKDLTDHMRAGLGVDDFRVVWSSAAPTDWLDGPEQADQAAEVAADDDGRDHLLGQLIDWESFWAQVTVDEDWIAHPLFPAGRGCVIYAPAKTGKSLIVLDVCAAVATGRSVLGSPPQPRRRVLYLDYEMTPADLRERLEDLGYGPDVDLSYLHYVSIPALGDLDTEDGGKNLLRLAELVDAELVVVDTFGRAVGGEENAADTVRAFYRNVGARMKAAGRALVRIDHQGKDGERGQRGSSAKNDDVDVVWRLTAGDDGLVLTRTHSRVAWVPDRLAITRQTEPCLAHRITPKAWPAGTKECAAALDRLGIADVSYRAAAKALRDAGERWRNEVVRRALEWRRAESVRAFADAEPVDNPNGAQCGAHWGARGAPENEGSEGRGAPRGALYPQGPGAPRGAPGRTEEKPRSDHGAHLGAHRGAPPAVNGAQRPPLKGGAAPDHLGAQTDAEAAEVIADGRPSAAEELGLL